MIWIHITNIFNSLFVWVGVIIFMKLHANCAWTLVTSKSSRERLMMVIKVYWLTIRYELKWNLSFCSLEKSLFVLSGVVSFSRSHIPFCLNASHLKKLKRLMMVSKVFLSIFGYDWNSKLVFVCLFYPWFRLA